MRLNGDRQFLWISVLTSASFCYQYLVLFNMLLPVMYVSVLH